MKFNEKVVQNIWDQTAVDALPKLLPGLRSHASQYIALPEDL